ncbi:ATP-binding protein [Halorientalis litorea]|uniref:ATP-binding protein n=1 Tax=Halorientalis litorea TaxID=2931977 RepID=UPI001FF52FD6|nr:ATP-binding protein [Halorientalis litorea]
MNVIRLLVGTAVCVTLIVAAGIAVDRRDSPSTYSFAVLCLLLGAFALLSAVPFGDITGLAGLRIVVLEFLTVAWLLFASTYTGRGPAISRPLLAGALGFAVAVVLGIGVGTIAPLEFRPFIFVANFVLQSLAVAFGLYGLFIASRSVFVYDDLTSGGVVLVGSLAVAFVSLSILLTLRRAVGQRATLDVSLAVLSVVALSVLVATYRSQVFTGGSSTGYRAREQVLEEMDDAVAIVDRAGRIVDCNGSFEAMFEVGRRQAVGKSIDADVDSLSAGETASLVTSNGHRECAVERTVLTAPNGTSIGTAYRIRDVTDRRTHEQRLEVLDRVLRHNLRNDLDAIRGFAEALETEASTVDPVELGARIRETASDLSDTCSTVEQSEQLLGREQLDPVALDTRSLVRDVLGQLTEEFPGSGVLQAEDAPTVRTDPSIVEAVVREVVENGLEHGPGAEARVVVELERSPEGAEITIRDNGPGIPDREAAVLLDGEETPLQHGSGVGLWLVDWGLSRLGGTLEVQTDGCVGSVVTLTVPDASL